MYVQIEFELNPTAKHVRNGFTLEEAMAKAEAKQAAFWLWSCEDEAVEEVIADQVQAHSAYEFENDIENALLALSKNEALLTTLLAEKESATGALATSSSSNDSSLRPTFETSSRDEGCSSNAACKDSELAVTRGRTGPSWACLGPRVFISTIKKLIRVRFSNVCPTHRAGFGIPWLSMVAVVFMVSMVSMEWQRCMEAA